MRKTMIACALALLAIPAFSLADGSSANPGSPAHRCAAQRTAIGAKAFADLYGTNASKSNAFGKCVSKLETSDNRTEQKAHTNAAKACDTERTQLGDDAFQDKYSTNKSKKNPHGTNGYGKCVSSTAKTQANKDENAQQKATINAARQCKTERSQLGKDAFKAKYGTNSNKSNAFGKCVSQKAKAQQQSQQQS